MYRPILTIVTVTLAAFALLGAAPAPVDDGDASTRFAWTIHGEDCDLIPPRTVAVGTPRAGGTTPVETGPCPGVRPGAAVTIGTDGCTMNFLFEGFRVHKGDRVSTGHYVATAGHCVVSPGVERTWSGNTGPVAYDGGGRRIGTVVYATLTDPKDFAVIRIDSEVKVNGQMCHWGGPLSMNRDLSKSPAVLRQSGQGDGFGQVVPGRTHVASSLADPHHVRAFGPALYGDSGSPVITEDGAAVGVLVAGGVFSGVRTDAVDTGVIHITRLGPQVDRAAAQLGLVDLQLLTAPLASVEDA